MASITDVERLAGFVRSRGADLPVVFANALAAWEAIGAFRKRAAGPALHSLLAGHVSAGTLTEQTVEKVIVEMAHRDAEAATARDAAFALEPIVVSTVTAALAGNGGDELTDALRPVFAADLAELAKGVAVMPEGITSEVAIERGPDVVAAWTAAPAIAARMEGWLTYARLLAGPFGLPNSGGVGMDHPQAPMACYFIGPGNDPAAAAIALADGPSSFRLGRFAKLWTTGFAVRLNSPREATALAEAAEETAQDALTREGARAAEVREELERRGQINRGERRVG